MIIFRCLDTFGSRQSIAHWSIIVYVVPNWKGIICIRFEHFILHYISNMKACISYTSHNMSMALSSIVLLLLYHHMMTSSNGNIFRVTGHLCGEFTGPGEFPSQRPVTRSFDVFFDLRPNKRLSKLECGAWSHHPRRLQCVWSRNLRIFKVAMWHFRCRHNLKNNYIWDNLQCCLSVPRSPSKPVMLTFDLQSRKV